MRKENSSTCTIKPTNSIIFDFDGTILDTEASDYLAWREIGSAMGIEIPIETFAMAAGADDLFTPCDFLEKVSGVQLDRATILKRWRRRFLELVGDSNISEELFPLLQWLRENGYQTAVASSSTQEWVLAHLTRLGIKDYFHSVCTRESAKRLKPSPDIYLAALDSLGVDPQEAIAIEDSLVGVQAAKSAGILCVALPNLVTRHVSLASADVTMHSFREICDWLEARQHIYETAKRTI